MKTYYIIALASVLVLSSCKKDKKTTQETEEVTEVVTTISKLKITPIEHATMVLEYEDQVIYIDPFGGKEAFKDQKPADLVFITDLHFDHLDIPTLDSLDLSKATIIAPLAVKEKLPKNLQRKTIVLHNGNAKTVKGIGIETVPMYNLRKEALHFHEKGRGNGYVLTIGKERIYISGDTEDIPEMRKLKNIDKAFVCMNLPWTMPVNNAASAVLDFKPKQVYPYHYRNKEGFSNVGLFKMQVNASSDEIEVIQLDWYVSSK
jgi:L-ascorbate metabolism protein UlaG (beta-lactamase superfamily)